VTFSDCQFVLFLDYWFSIHRKVSSVALFSRFSIFIIVSEDLSASVTVEEEGERDIDGRAKTDVDVVAIAASDIGL
jgi:hypothetical protein